MHVFGVARMVAVYSLQTATAETILRCNEPTWEVWEAQDKWSAHNANLVSLDAYCIQGALRLKTSIITDHVAIAGSDGLSSDTLG